MGNPVTVRFDLVQEGARGWRIDDIHGRTVTSLAAHLCRFFCKDLPADLRRQK
jgi:hypothetical protein